MRRYLYTLLLVAFTATTWAQCYPDRHNGTWFESWLSCEDAQSPNPTRGIGHWIHYDLGHDYLLGEFEIWNINDPGHLERGVQVLAIDISTDGVNWTDMGEYTVPMATGESIYEGVSLMDFESSEVRYLLLTVVSNYGSSDCQGFSELRLGVDGVVTDISESLIDASCFDISVYPNPHRDELNVTLRGHCGGDLDLRLYDALGRLMWSQETLAPAQGQRIIIDNSDLPAGIYFLQLNQGEAIGRYQVVKVN